MENNITTILANNTGIERKPNQFYAVQNLNNSEVEIVRANHDGIRICDMADNEIFILASAVYNQANARLNYKPKNADESKAEISIIYMDLNKFQGLTDREVLLALNSGLDGDFLNETESVFFNSANFVKWIKKFIQLQKMPALAKYQNNLTIAEKNEPKETPTFESMKKVAIDTANMYADNFRKENFIFPFSTWMLYDEIVRCEIYLTENKRKKEIWQEMKNTLAGITYEKMIEKCKDQCYREFIQMLVDFGCIIDENGKIKPLEN